MVDTSVAVAAPSITAVRIKIGNANAGNAIIKVRSTVFNGARLASILGSRRASRQQTKPIAIVATTAGIRPPTNRAEIDTLQTAPMVMSTRLGGMVSVIAPVDDSKATSSSGLEP